MTEKDHMQPGAAGPGEALLRLRGISVSYPIKSGIIPRTRGHVNAVEDVSLDIGRSEVVGLVGESGSGKSSLGRAIVGLVRPSSGNIEFGGRALSDMSAPPTLAERRRIQMVFQDPFSSLDPRMTVGASIGEPLAIHGLASGKALRDRVGELLHLVGIRPERAASYPAEFSGGQRQRICIARAIALEPDLIVADEAVSALDVSVQAQILNLFRRLRRDLGISFLFISHDLSVVANISSRVAVMYLGRIVEVAPTERLFRAPKHPYTQALIAAVPTTVPGARRTAELVGEVPSARNKPPGCSYHTRCPLAERRCREHVPRLLPADAPQRAACHVVNDATTDAAAAGPVGPLRNGTEA
jgi:peptide/nickel transport system ATP-binding protein/oligopeptide transport system ATP-binding protein